MENAPRRNIFDHEGAAVVCDIGWGAGGAREAKVAELCACRHSDMFKRAPPTTYVPSTVTAAATVHGPAASCWASGTRPIMTYVLDLRANR
jgi:hypothetical protein